MATVVGAGLGAKGGDAGASWDPSSYSFDPYALTVAPVTEDACGGGALDQAVSCGMDADGAGGEGSNPGKRRPGRQKRTSVLCQVGRATLPNVSHMPREAVGGGGAPLARSPGQADCTARYVPPRARRPPPLRRALVLQVSGCGEELVTAKKYYK